MRNLSLVCVACWLVSLAAPALGGEPHLEVRDLPDGFVHEAPVDWIEVGGYTWTGDSPFLDVVLAIDLSLSTLVASGSDIDGDGRVGRINRHAFDIGVREEPYRPNRFSTDPGDTVARAELKAARRFIEGVDFARTRVALVTFATHVRLWEPLSTKADPLLDAIERIEGQERRRIRNYSADIHAYASRGLAVAAAELARKASGDRRQEIILMTDGMPTKPRPTPARHLVATTMILQERGIGTHFFPLGPLARRNAPFFEFVDEHAGARHTMVGYRGEIVEKLPEARLDGILELEVENLTTGRLGRALRLFADGSFDAVVPLTPGDNRLVFRVTTEDDETVEVVRLMNHAPAPSDTPEGAMRQRRALDAIARRLAERTVESELVAELEAARARALEQERKLTVDVEPKAAPQ